MQKQTKSQIVDLALNFIQQNGYTNFSYDDIAKQLNISKAAIHYHFESKEDLGIAICQKIRENILTLYNENMQNIKNNHVSPWEFVSDMLNSIEPHENCPVSSLQADYENVSKNFQEEISKTSQLQLDLFLNLVKEFSPDIDISMVTPVFLSIKGALQYRRILGEDFFKQNITIIEKQLDNLLATN